MGQCVTIPMASDNMTERAYDYSHPQSQQAKMNGSSRMERQKRDDDASPIQEWSSSGDVSGNSTTPLMNSGGQSKQYSRSSRKKDRQKSHQSSDNQGQPNIQKFFSAVKQTVGPSSGDRSSGTDGPVYQKANGPNGFEGESPPGATSPSSSPRTVVLPPEEAIRTRCYRLNLDMSPFHSAHTPSGPNTGPMECSDEAAAGDNNVDALSHTNWMNTTTNNWSRDDMSISSNSQTNTLVSTAKIFRGLTINKDGTVISAHSRKSGSGTKTDEKSRQAAKIDKAFDLVEAAARGQTMKKKKTSSSKEEDEPESKMISLVIFGEYDDMKHLVRDGARRLKEAQDLPDDALLAMNRSRSLGSKSQMYNGHQNSWIPQSQSGSQRPTGAGGAGGVGGGVGGAGGDMSTTGSFRSGKSRHKMSQSTPPKLNRHPRDRPSSNSSRREMAKNSSSSKSKKFPPWKKNQSADIPIFGGVDSDWSDALQFSKGLYSMCVCGANSVSPTNNPGGGGAGGAGGAGGSSKYGEMGAVGTGVVNTNEGREPAVSGNGSSNKGGGGGGGSGRWRGGTTAADGREGASKDTILV